MYRGIKRKDAKAPLSRKQKTTLSIVSYAAVCRVVDDSVDPSQSLLYSRNCVVKVVEIECRKKKEIKQ